MYLVSDCRNGAMFANRDNAGPWETFTVTRLENGQFSIRSDCGKYLVAKEDGSLDANSPNMVTEGNFQIQL